MKLDVHVRGKRVASLYRERDEYVLRYDDASESDFVSLTMPVQDEPWRWPRDLHPFFRQNLPEGFLLNVLREEFGRYFDGTDLSLLALVGGAGIGRVTVTPEGVTPGQQLTPLDLNSLMRGQTTSAQFADLVRRYARAAISGVVPKFIAPEVVSDTQAGLVNKASLRTSHHIVKGSSDNTPFLALNEHYALKVLARLNVAPVARTELSEDGRVLLVERFDVDAQGGVTHGVEDACNLLGLPPQEKYAPTMERVLAATRAYLPGATRRRQLEYLGWHLLANFVVRNADCHSKNIALYYTDLGDVAYTPVYDIVTTQAYAGYRDSAPGLSIGGRRTWAPGKSLETFFKARLSIAPSDYAAMVTRVSESAVEVGRELIALARGEPSWRAVVKNMLHAWNEGMASLRDARMPKRFMGLTSDIEGAGFSDSDKQSKHPRIDQSPLMGKRRS